MDRDGLGSMVDRAQGVFVSEGLESGGHVRMTKNVEGPAWSGIPKQIGIFHCQLDWH